MRGFLVPSAGVQPRIITDARALSGMVGEPVGHLDLGHGNILPMAAVDLLADLERIAPVGEDRGLFGHHHRAARRAFKAGEPRQPLRIGADIRSEEHTSELQSLMRISYAVFCLK